jgi:hypothetical protein
MRLANTRTLVIAGMLVALSLPALRATAAEEKEGEEQNEVKVKLADVPAPVRTTLDKESFGATLPDQVDKETDDGKTVYEADVKLDGKNYEIKVSPDGTLVSKKLDQEDEKGAKHEDDEKNEKKDKDKD